MATLHLNGSLFAGPQAVTTDTFPGSSFTIPLGLAEGGTKGWTVGTGVLRRNLNSPAAFVALGGVGPAAGADAVTQGHTLYLRCDAGIDLEMTIDDGAGGTDVVVVHHKGLLIKEFDAARPLELLRAQGTATVEYLVVGNS